MPTFAYRAHLVAHDPVACARFFHRVVTAFLRFLIGFDPELLGKVETDRYGVLGDIIAYYCTTESQNRGALHLHGLFWSYGALHPDEFDAGLRSQEGADFRKRVVDFWEDCVSESVPESPATNIAARKYEYSVSEPLMVNDKPVIKDWVSAADSLLGLTAETEMVCATFSPDMICFARCNFPQADLCVIRAVMVTF